METFASIFPFVKLALLLRYERLPNAFLELGMNEVSFVLSNSVVPPSLISSGDFLVELNW